MKKAIAMSLMMLMLVLPLFGCVPRNDYDVLMAEYDSMRARVESLQSDLVTAQSDLAAEQSKTGKLESDLAAEQSKAGKLAGDLSAEQSKSEKLASDLTAEQSKVQKVEKDLSAAQSETKKMTGDYNALKRKVDRAQPYAYILDTTYWVEPYELTAQDWIELTALVEGLNDSECSEKYLAWVEATTQVKSDEAYGYFNWALWNGLYGALYPGGTTQ